MSRSDGDAGAPPASQRRGFAEAPEADETRGSSAERGTRTAPLGDVPAEDTGTARGCGVTAGAREAALAAAAVAPTAVPIEDCSPPAPPVAAVSREPAWGEDSQRML